MQIYAVLYDKNGRFLLCHKPEKGYYFFKKDEGKIIPSGQDLNGRNNYAFPGGKMENDSIIKEAAREFVEETRVNIASCLSTGNKFNKNGNYCAGYFLVDEAGLDDIFTQIKDTNIPEALKAASDIRDKKITSYDQIFIKYKNAPRDNELDGCEIWDLRNNWQTIETWKSPNSGLDWYYYILEYLKNKILKIDAFS